MTVRLAVPADRDALQGLFLLIRDDLIADYGQTSDFTIADVQGWLANPRTYLVVDETADGVIGVSLVKRKDDGSVQVQITGVSPALSPAQRMASFRAMIRFVAASVADDVVAWGIVRAGGRLDQYLSAQSGLTREALAGSRPAMVRHSGPATAVRLF